VGLTADRVPAVLAAGQGHGDGDRGEQGSAGGVEQPGVDAVDEGGACAGLDGAAGVDDQGFGLLVNAAASILSCFDTCAAYPGWLNSTAGETTLGVAESSAQRLS